MRLLPAVLAPSLRKARSPVGCLFMGAFLLSCGGGDTLGLEDGVPRLGRYSYTFNAGGVVANGTMILTSATKDEISGRFEISNFEQRMALGVFNVDAYVVYAFPNRGGTAITRLKPNEETGLFCEEARYLVSFGDSRVGTCSVAYLGR